MAKYKPRRLVIDASIANAASDRTAEPRSMRCNEFLIAIREAEHLMVITPGIQAEWNKHQCTFARKWRLEMIQSRKVVKLPDQYDAELWEKIPDTAVSDKQRDAMCKDIFLLEAALATDRCVASLDENTARKPFSRAAKTIPKLREIVWVNPDKPEENPIEWLQAGAPAEDFRMLGHAE
jgi:hypothetical protein